MLIPLTRVSLYMFQEAELDSNQLAVVSVRIYFLPFVSLMNDFVLNRPSTA
jgi:hypothetical protein